MDREGKFTPLRETPGDYSNPAFSPDGKRLALEISDGKRNDIWVYEWERDTLTRLTFGGETNGNPVWTPDGSGNPQRLTESKNIEYPRSWRPDGKVVALTELNPSTNFDIMTLSMEG